MENDRDYFTRKGGEVSHLVYANVNPDEGGSRSAGPSGLRVPGH